MLNINCYWLVNKLRLTTQWRSWWWWEGGRDRMCTNEWRRHTFLTAWRSWYASLSPVHTAYGTLRRRTHVESTCVNVRRRTAPYITVDVGHCNHIIWLLSLRTIALFSARRTATENNATQHAAQIELGMLRPSTYDDAVWVNAAVEMNVLDYNVAVRWCMATL